MIYFAVKIYSLNLERLNFKWKELLCEFNVNFSFDIPSLVTQSVKGQNWGQMGNENNI